jgi:hypothetical protein
VEKHDGERQSGLRVRSAKKAKVRNAHDEEIVVMVIGASMME